MNRMKSISSVLVAMLMLTGTAMAAGTVGNTGEHTAQTNGEVDITSPLADQHIGNYNGDVKIYYTKTAGINKVYYQVDNFSLVEDVALTGTITVENLANGDHTVKLTDVNGNLLEGDASVKFYMDREGPVLDASSLKATAITSRSITWAWDAATDASGVKQYHVNVYEGEGTIGTKIIRTDFLVTSGTSYKLEGDDIKPGTNYTITVQGEDDSIIQ